MVISLGGTTASSLGGTTMRAIESSVGSLRSNLRLEAIGAAGKYDFLCCKNAKLRLMHLETGLGVLLYPRWRLINRQEWVRCVIFRFADQGSKNRIRNGLEIRQKREAAGGRWGPPVGRPRGPTGPTYHPLAGPSSAVSFYPILIPKVDSPYCDLIRKYPRSIIMV